MQMNFMTNPSLWRAVLYFTALLCAVPYMRSQERMAAYVTEIGFVKIMKSHPPAKDDWNMTVIIPACNRLHSLAEAVESTRHQTYPIHEIVVAFDSNEQCFGHINNSHYIKNIWEEQAPPVKFLFLPPCPGGKESCGKQARARNFAVDNASPYATHFAFLDDDDVWLPQKTAIQVNAMKQANSSFCASDALCPKRRGRCNGAEYTSLGNLSNIEPTNFSIWNGGKHKRLISKRLGIRVEDPFPTNVTLSILSRHNYFMTSSVILAKDLFLGFDGNYMATKDEDYELWKRVLALPVTALFLNEGLVVYDNTRNEACETASTSLLFVK